MKALTFTLVLTDPVLVSQVGAGEENSSTAYAYIPGTVIRGAIISLYMKHHPGCDISQIQADRRFFFNDGVRYLNAYPQDSMGSRALPVPLSWKKEKNHADLDTAPVYDFAVKPRPDLTSIVAPRGPFVSLRNGNLEWVKLDWSLRVHNASEDRFVKKQNQSTVYRYDAIAPGQKFGAAILGEDTQILTEIMSLMSSETLSIGGSRSAGYGGCVVKDLLVVDDWAEYTRNPSTLSTVTITFLSDAVIRNPVGEFVTSIEHLIGTKPISSYAKNGLTGGFNRKWGLPIPQMPVIQAGSVFVYQKDDLDTAGLDKYMINGIGERLIEGFGRIAIDLNNSAEITPEIMGKHKPPVGPLPVLSSESKKLAEKMAIQRLRAVLNQHLVKSVAEINVTSVPHNAQLSRLRQTAQLMMSDQSTKPLADHLTNLKTNAKNQLYNARVGDQRLINWLESIVKDERVWEVRLKPGDAEMPSVAGVTAEITKEIKVEYLARLLDSVMRKASRS